MALKIRWTKRAENKFDKIKDIKSCKHHPLSWLFTHEMSVKIN